MQFAFLVFKPKRLFTFEPDYDERNYSELENMQLLACPLSVTPSIGNVKIISKSSSPIKESQGKQYSKS